MKKDNCPIKEKCWGYRHEILGYILIIIATILTLTTLSGLGIFAMFVAGLTFCCCKGVTHHFTCHTHHKDECMTDDVDSERIKSKKK